jgi:hypothetical protein
MRPTLLWLLAVILLTENANAQRDTSANSMVPGLQRSLNEARKKSTGTLGLSLERLRQHRLLLFWLLCDGHKGNQRRPRKLYAPCIVGQWADPSPAGGGDARGNAGANAYKAVRIAAFT